MKGIILAGGKGTRLYPSTLTVSKQLLPIYDKPMIYYPLSVLLMLEIKDILIISTKEDINNYKKLFGIGDKIGVNILYNIQNKANGIAEAFIIGEKFIDNDEVCLILGDNVFCGKYLPEILNQAKEENIGATIFAYQVDNPERFGVVQFDENCKIISIEEKPKKPKSKYAVPGLYFYNNNVINISKNIKKSKKRELEITSINKEYLKNSNLKVKILNKEIFWKDAGTPQGLFEASKFVRKFQLSTNKYIGCIEEISWRKGFINDIQLKKQAKKLKNAEYGKYILSVLEEEKK